MAFHIRDPKADRAVRELAARRGLSLTEAVRLAVENELRADRQGAEDIERSIRRVQEAARAKAGGGQVVDKAFYDELSGGL
jgi:antitoxin VapB